MFFCMSEEKDILKEKKNSFGGILIILVVLLVLNFFNFDKGVFADIVNPINRAAIQSSESAKDFVYVFSRLENLKQDYYQLKEDYLILKARDEKISLIYEENEALKKQLEVVEESEELMKSKVLYQSTGARMENLLISSGKNDGVKEGDIVVIGDVYIGYITEVSENTAQVRLPTSRGSRLKVMILEDDSVDEKPGYLNGIAKGYVNFVRVENIDPVGDLEVGNSVFTNDPKIGEYLYIGEVSEIGDDPAEAFNSCVLELPISYTRLNYVFVKED